MAIELTGMVYQHGLDNPGSPFADKCLAVLLAFATFVVTAMMVMDTVMVLIMLLVMVLIMASLRIVIIITNFEPMTTMIVNAIIGSLL